MDANLAQFTTFVSAMKYYLCNQIHWHCIGVLNFLNATTGKGNDKTFYVKTLNSIKD